MLLLKRFLIHNLAAGTVGVCITSPQLIEYSPLGRDPKSYLFSLANSVLILS
jgi:hypothetical protein